MKLTFFKIETPIVFNEQYINVLEIQNQNLFADCVLHLRQLNNDVENLQPIQYSEANDGVLHNEDFILINDIFSLDYEKSFSSKLLKLLTEKMNNQQSGLMMQDSFNNVKKIFEEQIVDLGGNIEYNTLVSLGDIIKLLNPKCNYLDFSSYFNTCLNFLDTLELLSIKKLLIFVDLKNYLTEKQLVEFYKQSKHLDINVLLLESKKSKLIEYEYKNCIDEDLYEYVEK